MIFFQVLTLVGVRGFFIKNANFNLDPHIATVIAQIACYDNKLPQGSPCSPVISNLITHSLDIKLASLAKKNSCIYTRYADDITFSTREVIFPSKIMEIRDGQYVGGRRLCLEIKRSGFSINEQKTRIQYSDSRQDVTGLVVNKKPNIRKEYWRTVRAQCNTLFKTGVFTDKVEGKHVEGSINVLEGRLNFIDQIDHYNRLRQKPPLDPNCLSKKEFLFQQRNVKKRRYLFNGREAVFSDFLFYRKFYSSDNPSILTEGKTDNTYLKSALWKLSGDYPSLAKQKTKTESFKSLLNFFNYSDRTKFLLELSGGADYLKDFVFNYQTNFKKYKAPLPKNPVIIIVDNDSGPKDLIGLIANASYGTIYPVALNKKTDIRACDFVHIFHNLYLVLTPVPAVNLTTDIESLFTDADRLRKYKNKCFNTVANRNEKTDLSKESFATNIVSAQRELVDFNGFKPLFDRLLLVISHYKSINP